MGSRFAILPSGEVVVGELKGGDRLGVYSQNGQITRQILLRSPDGVSGSGMPQTPAVSPEGTLHVADALFARVPFGRTLPSQRVRIFQPPVPQVNEVLAIDRNTTILQAIEPSRAGTKLFHVVDGRGRISRSFGDSTRIAWVGAFAATRRRIARGGDGRFWAIAPNNYRLVQWDTAGVVNRTLEVRSSWFSDWDERTDLPDIATDRWPTVIQGLATDGRGLLWILAWRPRSDWAPSPELTKPVEERRSWLDRSDYSRALESVVEVIDADCAVVVARRIVPFPLSGFVSTANAEVASVIPDRDRQAKGPMFTLARLRLEIPKGTQGNWCLKSR